MKKATSVFWISLLISLVLVVWGSLNPNHLNLVSLTLTNNILEDFGWFYLILVLCILLFCFFLMFSRFGNVKLGNQNEQPEFSRASWFAMLFSAGMGMGLVFWSTGRCR
ncbi:BCCT family transporter [Streptomyces sp. NPDC096934]|uniref:BCCT family transporter n=1 Tax=Streptomyces sp. NPDC096934 TaxID=3155551 RepID=UPI0033217334